MRRVIQPPHGSPTAGTDDGEALFETVALQHDEAEVVKAWRAGNPVCVSDPVAFVADNYESEVRAKLAAIGSKAENNGL